MRFADLRIWRDLDQDTVTDAGELFTLAEAGIASITVAEPTPSAAVVAGNPIAATGSFTRTDGSAAMREATVQWQKVSARPHTRPCDGIDCAHGPTGRRSFNPAAIMPSIRALWRAALAGARERAMFDRLGFKHVGRPDP
jgi:hypothetical protein